MGNTRAVTLAWSGTGMVFTGRGTLPETPAVTIDGDGAEGPSPMLALLLAAAGCSGSDVVLILGKMRVRLTRLELEVEGVRRDDDPRRYVAVHFRFTLAGEELDEAKATRAVDLSLEKYCSVVQSLRPDIDISREIVLA